MNSFVLVVVSLTFLKGFLVGRRSYGFVASILAIAFAVLSTLVLLATGEFSYGLFGYIAIPSILNRKKLF